MADTKSAYINAPGSAFRQCVWPDCVEQFDIGAVFAGETTAEGWVRYTGLGLIYICPAHAAAGHNPSRVINNVQPKPTCTPSCSCGWEGDPARPLGEAEDAWTTHLADVAGAK